MARKRTNKECMLHKAYMGLCAAVIMFMLLGANPLTAKAEADNGLLITAVPLENRDRACHPVGDGEDQNTDGDTDLQHGIPEKPEELQCPDLNSSDGEYWEHDGEQTLDPIPGEGEETGDDEEEVVPPEPDQPEPPVDGDQKDNVDPKDPTDNSGDVAVDPVENEDNVPDNSRELLIDGPNGAPSPLDTDAILTVIDGKGADVSESLAVEQRQYNSPEGSTGSSISENMPIETTPEGEKEVSTSTTNDIPAGQTDVNVPSGSDNSVVADNVDWQSSVGAPTVESTSDTGDGLPESIDNGYDDASYASVPLSAESNVPVSEFTTESDEDTSVSDTASTKENETESIKNTDNDKPVSDDNYMADASDTEKNHNPNTAIAQVPMMNKGGYHINVQTVVLFTTCAVVAVFYTLSIGSDMRVINWYKRKKRSNMTGGSPWM